MRQFSEQTRIYTYDGHFVLFSAVTDLPTSFTYRSVYSNNNQTTHDVSQGNSSPRAAVHDATTACNSERYKNSSPGQRSSSSYPYQVLLMSDH